MVSAADFLAYLSAYKLPQQYCVALSGGVDSCVLLHLLHQVRQSIPLQLRAIHINHGLSKHAKDWESFCLTLCSNYQIPCHIELLNLTKKPGDSLEELARDQRYKMFQAYLTEGEVLVTAHHQDDQAETLLLQLFRGAGPKGLASMPMLIPFGRGSLFRPFLLHSRADIEKYAKSHALQWIEDDSNTNLAFDRNFLRQNIMPLLKERWPALSSNLMRVAKHCAQADKFISTTIASIFTSIYDPVDNRLAIAPLVEHDRETQNYLLRYWFQHLAKPLPSTEKLEQLRLQLLCSRYDANPVIHWKGVEVRRYDHHLYAMDPLEPHDNSQVIPWQTQNDLVLPGSLGVLSKESLQQQGISIADCHDITIRFRRGGERCYLPNRHHSHSLKKLFQEWRVPPWQRDRVPLLFTGEELYAVIGYAVCSRRER